MHTARDTRPFRIHFDRVCSHRLPCQTSRNNVVWILNTCTSYKCTGGMWFENRMTRNRKAKPKVRAQQDTSITPQKGSSHARRETAKKRNHVARENYIERKSRTAWTKKKRSQSQVTLVSESERGRAKNCERLNWFSKNKSFFLVNIIKWITEAKRDKNKRENDISLPLYWQWKWPSFLLNTMPNFSPMIRFLASYSSWSRWMNVKHRETVANRQRNRKEIARAQTVTSTSSRIMYREASMFLYRFSSFAWYGMAWRDMAWHSPCIASLAERVSRLLAIVYRNLQHIIQSMSPVYYK